MSDCYYISRISSLDISQCKRNVHFCLWGLCCFPKSREDVVESWSLTGFLIFYFKSKCWQILISPAQVILIHIFSVCVQLLARIWLFVIPWTVTCQAPLSMEFSRQEYESMLPFPPPGIFPTQGSNLHLCVSCTGRQILYHCDTWDFTFFQIKFPGSGRSAGEG